MRKKFLVSMVAMAVLAGGLAWWGRSAASATVTSARSGGRGTSKVGGVVHLTAYSDNDGPESSAVVSGAIGDYGKAVRTYAGGKIEKEYNRLEVVVTHGSFQLEIAGLEGSLVRAFGEFPTDLSTCSGLEVVRGTTPVVAGTGRGAYAGMSGSFTMTATINEVDPWPRCPRAGDGFLRQTVFLSGTGTVSFGPAGDS